MKFVVVFVILPSILSIPVLPGQRRQRHDPSRSFPVDLRCQHGSTRFTQVGLPFPVLQGSPRLFLTCQKPPERPPVHPGPSGIIPVHHGGLRFNPRYSPVHPGSWTGVNRGVPGAQWDWGINDLKFLSDAVRIDSSLATLLFTTCFSRIKHCININCAALHCQTECITPSVHNNTNINY